MPKSTCLAKLSGLGLGPCRSREFWNQALRRDPQVEFHLWDQDPLAIRAQHAAHMFVYIYIHVLYLYTHTCKHTSMHACKHMIHLYIYIYIHMYIPCIYIYALYISLHTDAHVAARVQPRPGQEQRRAALAAVGCGVRGRSQGMK